MSESNTWGSIGLGFNSSKSKQTTTTNSASNSNFNGLTTPLVPDWITGPISDRLGRLNTIGGMDPASFVAGKDPLQILAGERAGGLGPSPLWDQASDLTRGSVMSGGPATASAASAHGGIPSYMNPYLQDVVDASLADFDADAGMQRAQLGLGLAGRRSGSGADISTALLGGQLARARGSLSSGLRSQGWNTAAEYADRDAARRTEVDLFNAGAANNYFSQQAAQRLGAGGQLASIADSHGANARADIGAMAGLGGTFRDINKERLTSPMQQLGWEVSQIGGLPLSLFPGQQTSNTTVGSESSTGVTKTKSSGFSAEGTLGFA